MENEQQLFLVEFLVDQVNVPTIRAIHEEMLPVTTCVSFQILGLPPINICQESSTEGCACQNGETQLFKKGKSCLFALPTVVLQKPLHAFPITMSVYKKLPPGVLPDVMLIGCHQIQMKDTINYLLSERAFSGGNPCKTTKSSFPIKTATGQCVGDVTVFIRASCFGRKIVTQFQIPHNRKPYLFKGIDNSPVFQCKKISSTEQTPARRCNCPVKKVDGGGEATVKTCCPAPGVFAGTGSGSTHDDCARPCCPSELRSNISSRQQETSSAPCPPCCGSKVPDIPKANCTPCCVVTSQGRAEFIGRGPKLRKCGCVIKEEQSCTCRG